jgi:chitin synthase
MSLPRRPTESSPRRRERAPRYQDSPTRRSRATDVESTPYRDDPPTPRSARRPRQQAFIQAPPSPGLQLDRDDFISPVQELGRKKSLVRPERGRIDPDHPNYYYRRHAQNMTVYPSTTGNEPIVETFDDVNDGSSEDIDIKTYRGREPGRLGNVTPTQQEGEKLKEAPASGTSRRLKRKAAKENTKLLTEEEKQWRKQQEALRPPSIWNIYCAIVTFWAPGAILACFGKPARAQQRAWREKMGLISIILLICAFVGFLTFGFTEAACGKPVQRFKINEVDQGNMIFHGKAYNMAGKNSAHPGAEGIPNGARMVFDFPGQFGGQDGSFLFQNVNGACKGLIKGTSNTSIPTNNNGDLAWYFPCKPFNQDGSSKPNNTFEYYNGYACHTTGPSREAFYSPKYSRPSGDVVFSWDDLKNASRNLTVYSGAVLDLNLISWFDSSQIVVPQEFNDLQENMAVRGVDLTHAFQSPAQKELGRCLAQVIKVGSIDTETVGCIASQVVLYVSLVFILAIVGSKFVLALLFQWFFSRKFAAAKSSISSDPKKRAQQIEDWSNDIYRAPPRLVDATAPITNKRSSMFLPTTSRFTNPYDTERSAKKRPAPTTMASQSSTSRLLPPGPLSRSGDGSDSGIDPSLRYSQAGSRSSLLLSSAAIDNRQSVALSELDGGMPRGFIHESVVAQPPPDWQPFGYPLAHTLCLVTAYSEGEEGIRTTINSIATTEYPNSHKTILVICDGMVKGHGEELTTPEIVLSMMCDHATLPDEVQAFSYVAVASGSKRHNMAKIYAGFYDYGEHSVIPKRQQQRVPMVVVVKTGTPDESHKSKPGNRGKRDSQIILMSFLQKVMFDERMTELEFEMFNGLWKVTGISPDFYELVLMVDADTKVFPDSLTHMASAMVKDPEIMGLCGETKIANKRSSWVSMIQVFEYFISHHLSKSFESVFGGVTCLPGCFSMYRIKAPKGGQNYWVPILANPDVVEHYSENVVDTLHKKNLLLLGEDRYLSTLMLRTFPKRKQVFVPQAVCKTTVPEQFSVLLSQRRRWINSTVHNLMELALVRDLCGTFCFSMQFIVTIELIGTLVLPAAISFTFYLIVISFVRKPVPVIPLILLALILGLPAILIVLTAHRWSYVAWMLIYLVSLPVWNFVLPVYAYWKFDDFSWGDTRKTAGEKTKKAGIEYEGEFDSSKITMKRWGDFEKGKQFYL